MNIETTITMGGDRLERIIDAARHLNVSKTKLISSVVHHMSLKSGRKARALKQVAYQQRRDKTEWRRVHLFLRGDEYEFLIDLRKVFKLSVSFIVSEAVDLYLSEIEELLLGDGDSYRYRNYAMMNTIINGVSCWLFCWGIPTEIITFPPEETM